MSEFRVFSIVEQEATFDGDYNLAIDNLLLMKIINHRAAEDEQEANEFKNPKRVCVRVIISVMEKE